MLLDVALLKTQLYEVRIKGKVEQVAIEKEAFESPSTKVANFTLFTLIMYWHRM